MVAEAEQRIFLVIVAAGSGERFRRSTPDQQTRFSQLPKQYCLIDELPVLGHTLLAFNNIRLDGVTVVLHPQDPHWLRIPGIPLKHRIKTTTGGQQRHDSVRNGIQSLGASADDWVLVHDAARPCVSEAEINALTEQCLHHQRGGLLVRPLTDTIKLSTDGERVSRTLNREQLFAALTPQMFRCGELIRALSVFEAGTITDEASAMEAQGQQPLMVKGSRHNIKITEFEDLGLARSILHQQGRLL
jgi:2-C-methyl-D-erythritol 4-phosphate cytidylyltransferase